MKKVFLAAVLATALFVGVTAQPAPAVVHEIYAAWCAGKGEIEPPGPVPRRQQELRDARHEERGRFGSSVHRGVQAPACWSTSTSTRLTSRSSRPATIIVIGADARRAAVSGGVHDRSELPSVLELREPAGSGLAHGYRVGNPTFPTRRHLGSLRRRGCRELAGGVRDRERRRPSSRRSPEPAMACGRSFPHSLRSRACRAQARSCRDCSRHHAAVFASSVPSRSFRARSPRRIVNLPPSCAAASHLLRTRCAESLGFHAPTCSEVVPALVGIDRVQEPQPVEGFATDEDEFAVALFEDRPVKDRLLVLEGEEKPGQSTQHGEVEGARRRILKPVEDVAGKCDRAGLGVLETPRKCRDPSLLVRRPRSSPVSRAPSACARTGPRFPPPFRPASRSGVLPSRRAARCPDRRESACA